MDLDTSALIAQAINLAFPIAAAAAVMVAKRAVDVWNQRTGLLVDQAEEAKLLSTVQAGAGILRTKLLQGGMSLDHIRIDNPAVAFAAQQAMTALDSLHLDPTKVTSLIVAKMGHVLGEDDSIPTVAAPPAVPAAPIAAAGTTLALVPPA